MNVLTWILLIAIVIIVAKYNYESWSSTRKIDKPTGGNDEGLKILYRDKLIPSGTAIPHVITSTIPVIKYSKADEKKYYMLALVDPDSPTHKNPTYREWRHWVVGNIPGDVLKRGFTGNEGTTIETYGPPKPPSNTGYHRYYFKLYQQPHEIKLPDFRGSERRGWKSSKFAEGLGMKKIDQTYFRTKRTSDNNPKNIQQKIIHK